MDTDRLKSWPNFWNQPSLARGARGPADKGVLCHGGPAALWGRGAPSERGRVPPAAGDAPGEVGGASFPTLPAGPGPEPPCPVQGAPSRDPPAHGRRAQRPAGEEEEALQRARSASTARPEDCPARGPASGRRSAGGGGAACGPRGSSCRARGLKLTSPRRPQAGVRPGCVASLTQWSLLITAAQEGRRGSHRPGGGVPSRLRTGPSGGSFEPQTRHLEAGTRRLASEAFASVQATFFITSASPASELTAAALRCTLPALFRQELGLCSWWLCWTPFSSCGAELKQKQKLREICEQVDRRWLGLACSDSLSASECEGGGSGRPWWSC